MRKAIMVILILAITISLFSDDIVQKITYSNKGSRSEARHGYLLYKGKSIPDVFNKIIYKSNVYIFFQRIEMWGDDGYFPYNEEIKIKDSNDNISKEQLEKGWYLGKDRLQGTPENWIYVEWEDKSAFLSLDKINPFTREFEMETIDRQQLDDFRG